MSYFPVAEHWVPPPRCAKTVFEDTGRAKAPEEYSTNPNTIKARRRKMGLSGVKKVEDAARTADYKALCYARKIVEAKPEYLAASDMEKASMLEQSMRDTMEKRRIKGQDTMSKLAAFQADDARALRAGTRGPQTRVPPISQFLEANGFAPARAGRQTQGFSSASPSINNHSDQYAGPSSASYPDVGIISTPGLNGDNGTHDSLICSSSNVFMPSHLPHDNRHIKVSETPTPFDNTTPGLMDSIEVDPTDDIAVLRNEMSGLRDMCQNVIRSNNHLGQDHPQNTRPELTSDQDHVANLTGRLNHLESVVRAIHNVSVPAVVDRVAALEGAMAELKGKIGDGCDGEVAKMREVFGSLREALARVGDFL